MSKSWYLVAGVLVLPAVVPLTTAGRQTAPVGASQPAAPVRISRAEAAALSKEIAP